MTPTERWMIGLALVYSVPSFISGIGITLLVVRWQEIRRAVGRIPRRLFPALERRNLIGASLMPFDEGLRLLA